MAPLERCSSAEATIDPCLSLSLFPQVLTTMDPVNLFDVLFEIMSAYGTSGLSMGGPGLPYSLCGAFTPFSKARRDRLSAALPAIKYP